MMKLRTLFGIYGKILSYTLLILLVVIVVIAVFFSNQINIMLEDMEIRQFKSMFEPLITQFEGNTREEMIISAVEFHEKNTSIEFYILAENGNPIYITPGAMVPESNLPVRVKGDPDAKDDLNLQMLSEDKLQMSIRLPNGSTVFMMGESFLSSIYKEFVAKTIAVLVCLFVAGAICAAAFAWRITKPIKRLAHDTQQMSDLNFVPPPVVRKDEIGQLAEYVYKMYEDLKTEIEREREMEENQRYFFSAASYELKTPVAAVNNLLESMIEEWIPPAEYKKSMRECLKINNTQGKLISEIIDIVRLSNEKTQFNIEPENLQIIIQTILPSYQTLADAKEQIITVSVPETLMCVVDRHMFSRVISNIIMNAVQNTPEHGEIRIWSENKNDAPTIRLNILNTNTLIEEEVISKLFEPFYRMDKVRNKSAGHSGLGLTIVKKALDCMNIPFSLENTTEGVLFWMDIPAQ